MIHTRFHYEVRGGHTHVAVFSVYDANAQFAQSLENRTHGKCGDLVFGNAEFECFKQKLESSPSFQFVPVLGAKAA